MWGNRFAHGVMAVIGPVGALGYANRIDAKKIQGGFYVFTILRGIKRAGMLIGNVTVLQKNESAQRRAKRDRARRFAHVVAVAHGALNFFAEITKQATHEHICAFRNPGDVFGVDVSCWRVDALDRFKWMRSFVKSALRKRITVQG